MDWTGLLKTSNSDSGNRSTTWILVPKSTSTAVSYMLPLARTIDLAEELHVVYAVPVLEYTY
jgi:hypothetical protein